MPPRSWGRLGVQTGSRSAMSVRDVGWSPGPGFLPGRPTRGADMLGRATPGIPWRPSPQMTRASPPFMAGIQAGIRRHGTPARCPTSSRSRRIARSGPLSQDAASECQRCGSRREEFHDLGGGYDRRAGHDDLRADASWFCTRATRPDSAARGHELLHDICQLWQPSCVTSAARRVGRQWRCPTQRGIPIASAGSCSTVRSRWAALERPMTRPPKKRSRL